MSEKKRMTKEDARRLLLRPRLRFEPKSPERVAAERAKREARLEALVGKKMPDGTVFAGISPHTKKPMYVAPVDASRCMTFNEAAAYAEHLEIGGKKDFRVPTKEELGVLYQNKERGALAGTFNVTALSAAGCYWSSTPDAPGYNSCAIALCFSEDGRVFIGNKTYKQSVRCVRG